MEFRESIKAWLEENCPPSMRTPMPNSEQVWASSKISFPSKEAEDGIRDAQESRGLGDVYKRQCIFDTLMEV